MSDLIKRSDAIEALGEEPYVWTDDDEFAQGERSQWIDDASAIKAVPSADRPQEWIPCSEQLPDEGEVVLVFMRIESHKAEWEEQCSIEFGRISSDRYDCCGTGWEWLNESGADYWAADWNHSILAWMPLPKPWKGADDE